jgi:hypothetical protein
MMSFDRNNYLTQNFNRSQHSTQDALRDIAIEEGIQSVNENEMEEVSLNFTDSDVKIRLIESVFCFKSTYR